jgi:hypothetical protein
MRTPLPAIADEVNRMSNCEFIAGLGAAAWLPAVGAQQREPRRLIFLGSQRRISFRLRQGQNLSGGRSVGLS